MPIRRLKIGERRQGESGTWIALPTTDLRSKFQPAMKVWRCSQALLPGRPRVVHGFRQASIDRLTLVPVLDRCGAEPAMTVPILRAPAVAKPLIRLT